MTLNISLLERCLLAGKWDSSVLSQNQVINLVNAVVDGKFREVLTSIPARKLFQLTSPNIVDQPLDSLFDAAAPLSDDQAEGELLRLTIAVACLHAFIQANWTGPNINIAPLEALILHSDTSPTITEEFLNEKAISELSYGGEPAYHLGQVAIYLRIAQILLDLPYLHCGSALWWRLRTHLIHQQILDEPVPLPTDVIDSFRSLEAIYSNDPELHGRLLLEIGQLHHFWSQDKIAAEYFVRAARATGLEYELTGALGKRTKFQVNELSQLVLLAESRLSITDEEPSQIGSSVPSPTADAQIPQTLLLNDDTLLEHTEFTSSNLGASSSALAHLNPSSQPPLHPLDQCILLSLCLNVKNTSPVHGLTGEQMSPYVSRVISHPKNWSIHTMALLLRSRLESTRTRTIER